MELPVLGRLETMGFNVAEDSTDRENTLGDGDCVEPQTPISRAGTLLPGPIANVVSFATRSTSLALRIGTTIGGLGLGAAQVTTLSSLELGRSILHGILSRTGGDVFTTSLPSDLSRRDTESILISSLESMHQSMSRLVFWTAACFHTVDVAASTTSQVSQLFLSVLDQFFGSTDSSRAVASIITLIRREFQNPATGVQGEKVSVMDLVLGLCGLAYLQNQCRKMIQDQDRRLGYEETIWDVIVLSDREHLDAFHDGTGHIDKAETLGSYDPNNVTSEVKDYNLERDMANSDDRDNHLFETQLEKQIANSLPRDANISISTSTTTTKKITVDITGKRGMSIPPLPGLDLVESEVYDHQVSQGRQDQTIKYRAVYTVSRNRVQNITGNTQQETGPLTNRLDSKDAEQSTSPIDLGTGEPGAIPPIPLKLIHSAIASLPKRRNAIRSQGPPRRATSTPNGATDSGTGSSKDRLPKDLMDKSNTANQKIARGFIECSRKCNKGAPGNAKTLDIKPYRGSDTGEKKTGFRGGVPKKRSSLSRESSTDDMTTNNTKSASMGYKPSQRRSSKVLASLGTSNQSTRARPSSVSPVRDNGQDSLVCSTNTAPIHSLESPISPSADEGEVKAATTVITQKQEYNAESSTPSPPESRRQSTSREPNEYFPTVYTLNTCESQASLVISSGYPRSSYSDSTDLDCLRRSGGARGMFPDFHFLRNLTRYSRYASAVYGHRFLRLMGISKDRPAQEIADKVHYDVRFFAHHSKLPCDSVLLASFVDPQGGSDASGATDTGIPLVHTVALDKESKAVVFTCRGTLGFADVLADMMCDYDDLVWRGKTYNIHKGIHASARRLLYGGDGRLLFTIKAALDEYPEYGLVLCGHSLGGSVAALLGVMLAEPSITGAGFVTSNTEHRKFLGNSGVRETRANICLPPGRPIHVYAYGPLATMSPSLQKATRGLITSTIHGNDVVPYLSLGVLHDFQALALAFKTDNHEAKAEIKRRVWDGLRSGLADKWYSNPTKNSNEDDEHWAFIALKTLSASMVSPKLLPPGEVFRVESTKVMRKDASARETVEDLGRPASRVVLKYIRDVEAHFRQVRFGASMLIDHSPGLYEDALRRLSLGVAEL